MINLQRTDIETSVTGTVSTSTVRNQTAEAELPNHVTLYADYMVNDDSYVKLGLVNVDLDTNESLLQDQNT